MCNYTQQEAIAVTQKQSQKQHITNPHTQLYIDLLFQLLPYKAVDQQLHHDNKEELKRPLLLSSDRGHHMNSHDTCPPSHFIPEIIREIRSLSSLAFPILLTYLILYSRSMISVLFLGRLGDLELAAGALAIAVANITGFSVLSGLSLGMEPLCSQAFGAGRPKLLSLTLHRCVIFLLCSSLPISFLWLYVLPPLFHTLHQQQGITRLAHTYLLYSLPDLVTNSFFHPIRIYLRAQGITHPLTWAALAGTIVHVPVNLLLVTHLNLGVAGVAVASAATNFIALLFLVSYIWITGLHKPTWTPPSKDSLRGWMPLVRLAAPSCVSVCLEWWWYEIMIVLCGLLVDPKATVASMGVLIQTTGLIYNFPSSLSFAVSTRVGHELGANRPHKAKLSAYVSIVMASLMGLTAMLFASSMRYKWAQMYTNDVDILKLTASALPILGLCELGNCPQTVGCGVVRGTARPTTAANVNLGAFYLVGMPVAVGLAFYMGAGFNGLWIGLLSAQICCAGLMLYVVGTTDWENQAERAQMLTGNNGAVAAPHLTAPVDTSDSMLLHPSPPPVAPPPSGDDGSRGGVGGHAADRTSDLKEPLTCIVVIPS